MSAMTIKFRQYMRAIIVVSLLLAFANAFADEYRPAYLELKQTTAANFEVLWKVPEKIQGKRLKLQVSFPPDVTAIARVRSATIAGTSIKQWAITRQAGLAEANISIKGLDRVPTDVLVRIERLDGTSETARLNAASTSFVVKGAPDTWDVVNTYLVFGVEHILEGFDHLLFVTCLIFIAGTWRRILITITGFTLAHSITLTLAGLELVRLPISPIEATIALSIVFLAREIVLDRRDTLTWRYPIAVSSTFGLLHGFGFASALSEIGLPQTEIFSALLAFNVGVEIGQVIFVSGILLLFMAANYLLKVVNINSISWVHVGEKPVAYGVGGIAMMWTVERLAFLL